MSDRPDSKVARAAIFARLRRTLDTVGPLEARQQRVAAHIAAHPSGLVPARAAGDAAVLIELLRAQLQAVEATTERVAMGELAAAIANYLRAAGLPLCVRHGADPLFAAIEPAQEPELIIETGPARKSDAVSLTHAFAAAAETGTLFVASGPDNPVSLSFLPETNIAVVRSEDIVGSYEEAWARLRRQMGDGVMPRTVNLISGPSRTADIEQTLITGAHGPRRLHVIIIDDHSRF